MAEPIDEKTVRHIARLARLELSDEEVRKYTHQLGEILAYVRQLDAVNTEGVEPTAHALAVSNVLREDVPVAPLGAEKVLANAPRSAAGYFALPKVLDQETA